MRRDSQAPGRTFRRGDPGYEEARRESCWNAHLPDRYPDIIVQAGDEEEVAAAVRLAGEKGWTVGIRSGGHSWSGNHLRDGGMLLDVSRLNGAEVDEEALSARVGPGCRQEVFARLLAKKKLFFPTGHCRGLALGGYLLQGGFGWNSRALGLACEHVTAIDYVGADGVPRHASESENADMLWAARGAGPGFFAAVTRFHLKLHPRPKAIGARLAFYPIRRLETLFRWADRIGPEVPRSVELMLAVSRRTPFVRGPGISLIAPVFAENVGAARRDLGFMKSRPRGARVATPFLPMRLPWLVAGVMGHYPDRHCYAADNMWTGAAIDDLLPGLLRIAETLPPKLSHMVWINWSPPDSRPDMAYSLEDRTYIALYGVCGDAEAEPSTLSWVSDRMRDMAPLASGMVLADENLAVRPGRFLADSNMARLDALRARYDPKGRFHSYMGRL